MTQEQQKKLVGEAAAHHLMIKSNTVVGIGAGTTIWNYFIPELGKRIREEGLVGIKAVSTSDRTTELCKKKENGIKMIPLKKKTRIAIAIDGADEVDAHYNLIKGGGGAHVREKKIDYRAKHFVVVVDESKMVKTLGAFHLPVEVKKKSYQKVAAEIKKQKFGGPAVSLRIDPETTEPFVTDNNNYILKVDYKEINNPAHLEEIIQKIPGVVKGGIGIFTRDHVHEVWIGHDDWVEKRILKK